MLIFIQA